MSKDPRVSQWCCQGRIFFWGEGGKQGVIREEGGEGCVPWGQLEVKRARGHSLLLKYYPYLKNIYENLYEKEV